MDPNSGRMHDVTTTIEPGGKERHTVKETGEPVPAHWVLFKEGQRVTINGCDFIVDTVRRHRVSLTPIAKASS